MPLTIDVLVGQVGYPLQILEELAAAMPNGSGNLFLVKTFRKRRGGIREIVKPYPLLDAVSKNLYRSLLSLLPYRPPSHVHGFVSGRSIRTNASAHLGKQCVLRVDLEDFFPSIRSAAIKTALQGQDCDEKAADLIVSLSTVFDKLPIGLSTSPFLSNLAFLDTDNALLRYAISNGLSFTRYVDDLIFSGEVSDEHFDAIEQLLNDFGWSINVNKTAFMRRGGPQYVTGLYVGMSDRPRIPRSLKRQMRRILYLIERYGYDSYMEDFGGESDGMFPRRLHGWACYIASIEPNLGYSLLRALEETVPSEYTSPRDMAAYYDWIEVVEDIDDLRGFPGPEY